MTDTSPAQLIDEVDEFFDGVFAPLDAWLPRLQAQLREQLQASSGRGAAFAGSTGAAGGTLTGAALAALVEADAHAVLTGTDRPLYGAGFCATEAIVSEGNPLAWWQGPERTLLASSTFGPGQAAIDLQRLEWYRVPAETGERHVAGPFVDYLCSNEITLTNSLPVMLDGEFAGVMCADVLVATIEDFLLPRIERFGGAALVNTNGRVVFSADPQFETGDRFTAALDAATGELRDDPRHLTRSSKYPFALYIP